MGTNTVGRYLNLEGKKVHPILFIHNLRSYESPPDPLFSTILSTVFNELIDEVKLKEGSNDTHALSSGGEEKGRRSRPFSSPLITPAALSLVAQRGTLKGFTNTN
jgi:hypothetical protein